MLAPANVINKIPPPATDRGEFINAMGAAVNGVNVVTTDGTAGRFGLTVSAVSSVSADPPLLLVCINRRSPMCSAILENGVFCINLLSTQQKEISDTFSGRPQQGPPYDFGCGQWTVGETGSPVLQGAVSDFDCRMERRYDAGSHTIFLGAVVDVLATESSPLLYSRRDYGYLTRLNAHNH